MKCQVALNKMLGGLVERYFETYAAKSKKAEHAEMMRLGIASGSYQDFLKRRREGRTRGEIANLHRNAEWIAQLVHQAGKETEFSYLKRALQQAKADREAA